MGVERERGDGLRLGVNGERVKEFLWFYFYVPVNNFSVMAGRVSRVESVLSRIQQRCLQ